MTKENEEWWGNEQKEYEHIPLSDMHTALLLLVIHKIPTESQRPEKYLYIKKTKPFVSLRVFGGQ